MGGATVGLCTAISLVQLGVNIDPDALVSSLAGIINLDKFESAFKIQLKLGEVILGGSAAVGAIIGMILEHRLTKDDHPCGGSPQDDRYNDPDNYMF